MLFSAVAGTLTAAAEALSTSSTVIGASGIGLGGTTSVAAPTISASAIQGATTAAGLGLSGLGLATQFVGQSRLAEASKRAEDIRERQANLQALRERREIIRKAQAARAIALANTTSAGASAEGSSALGGAYGQIGSEGARAISASFENQELGTQYFATQRDIAGAKSTAAFGAGIADLGKQTVLGADEIGRIGSTLFGRA